MTSPLKPRPLSERITPEEKAELEKAAVDAYQQKHKLGPYAPKSEPTSSKKKFSLLTTLTSLVKTFFQTLGRILNRIWEWIAWEWEVILFGGFIILIFGGLIAVLSYKTPIFEV